VIPDIQLALCSENTILLKEKCDGVDAKVLSQTVDKASIMRRLDFLGLIVKKRKCIALLFCSLVICLNGQNAAAQARTGKFAGVHQNGFTTVGLTLTRQGVINNIQIAALQSLCQVTIPDSGQLPAEERSTSITKREIPSIRLRSGGRFRSEFELSNTSRVDFRGARIIMSGRLRGSTGTVSITLQFDKSYEDGSTETCGGSADIRLSQRLSSGQR